ncbi:MAG: hypothetical protein R3D45_13985 [Rhizobiaceae bacterium]
MRHGDNMLERNTKFSRTPIIEASVATLLAATSPQMAWAEDKNGAFSPFVEGELELELGNDLTFRSDDPANELNDLYFSGALAVVFGLTPWLSVNGGLTFEPVLDPLPATDRYFGDLGLYVDTLNVQVDIGNLSVVAGKFGPGFGTAWDVTPGVFGTGFAEDYELAEMIGFGATYTAEGLPIGTVAVGGNVFFVDTTALSDSIFTSRGRVMESDGGIGNTERLDNVSLAIDGSDVPGAEGLFWHLGYSHLSAGLGDVADQNGFAGGIGTERELSNGMVLTANGEIAYFDGFGGTPDDAIYLTGGLSLANGPWHGELASTIRRINVAGGPNVNDLLVQLSGGHEFDNGIDVSLGYAFWRDAGIDNHTFGLRLTKTLEFSTRN